MPSNSQHRPGANVTLSPAAHCKEKLKKVDNLEEQLVKLADTKSDEQASKFRMRLCEVLSDIILTDPLFSIKHDCIGRLWRNCFYAPIGILRARIAREKRKKLPNGPKLQKTLNHFLSEAITLYDYLMTSYHTKLKQADPTMSLSLTPGGSQSQSQQSQSQVATKDPAGVVPGLFRMYIHMGDLYRYEANYSKAQEFYEKASKLAPGSGNPYNQLAVVAQLKDTAAPLNTVALYWYARSLLTTHEPFEVSKANLARLFQSNRDWFHKQEKPSLTNGGGGRDNAKAQRTVASRYFLSQFVDLHFSFFQGIAKNSTTENVNNENKEKNTALNCDEVVSQIDGCLEPFASLLRAAGFGDALLCKLIAICAFSEAYNKITDRKGKDKKKKNEDDVKVTTMLARTFTLSVGASLAERAAVNLTKVKDQAEKLMGNPGQVPSARVLAPLLLVCEYVENFPIMVDGQQSSGDMISGEARSFCKKTNDSYWLKVADVMNILTGLKAHLNLGSVDLKTASLKEFKSMIGYAPFQPFLNDSMAPARQDGYASIEEAVDVLELRLSQTQDSYTQQSLTQDSTAGRGAQSVDDFKIKVARFLAFGNRMASSNVGIAQQFVCNPDGLYIWKANDDAMEMDYNDNQMMMDTENDEDNDTQPPATKKNGNDVLVYSAPKGGGPALLVPGMLLQNRALAPTAVATAAPQHQQALARPPPPPPGFGSVSFAPQPPAHARLAVGTTTAMPPGISQGLTEGYHQEQPAHPTVGNPLHMFGGPQALHTKNPFANASMNGMQYGGMAANGGDHLQAQPLFNGGGNGATENSLLGSGFLDGLFDDTATKNPFAT